MLNFYSNPLSPYATKVHFLLEEAAIPYKYHFVDARDPKGRDLLDKVSPFGKVPAIEHAGFMLGESAAILRYLVQRQQLHSLYPANLEDRAQVDMLIDFTQLHVSRWLISLAWHLSIGPKFGQPADDWAVAEARSNLPGSLARLERWLHGRTFLCGSELTIADLSFQPFAAQNKLGQVSFADYPNLAAWAARMNERSAWKKTHADLERRIAEFMNQAR